MSTALYLSWLNQQLPLERFYFNWSAFIWWSAFIFPAERLSVPA
jgi:hypothetical protein